MFLVGVSLPWHKTDAESHVDIFLSTSQKKRSKKHVVTKSLYIMTWFVCLNKFECLKNVETFQTPTFLPKTCCLRFSNKLCKRILNVSLRFVDNSSSECLQNVALFHHWEIYQTNASSNCVPFILDIWIFLPLTPKSQKWILRANSSSTKLKWRIWKINRFSISFYGFKASPYSVQPNQSRQRRWKTYRCKVSPSSAKAASYGACKNDVNHHGWAHYQAENTSTLPAMQKRSSGFISLWKISVAFMAQLVWTLVALRSRLRAKTTVDLTSGNFQYFSASWGQATTCHMCFWSLLWSWQKDVNRRLRICFVSRSDTSTRTIATWAETSPFVACVCGKSGLHVAHLCQSIMLELFGYCCRRLSQHGVGDCHCLNSVNLQNAIVFPAW